MDTICRLPVSGNSFIPRETGKNGFRPRAGEQRDTAWRNPGNRKAIKRLDGTVRRPHRLTAPAEPATMPRSASSTGSAAMTSSVANCTTGTRRRPNGPSIWVRRRSTGGARDRRFPPKRNDRKDYASIADGPAIAICRARPEACGIVWNTHRRIETTFSHAACETEGEQ